MEAKQTIQLLTLLFGVFGFPLAPVAADNSLSVQGETILFHGRPIKILGLRCSNALMNENTTNDLIEALDLYQGYGLNSLSVFVMGSRFGDVKGYLPDASMDPVYLTRLKRILDAAQKRNIIAIVGCLYWGTSRAKEDLKAWTQEDANRAVANTARWLGEKGYRYVILDPDNEGMAVREMRWQIEPMIQAAKQAHPSLLVANNTKQKSSSEDLNMHFAKPKPGKPWLDSESTPRQVPLSGYWGRFSKEAHQADAAFHNYSRIGRYTEEMKQSQLEITHNLVTHHSGLLFASTWLQCAPGQGGDGPFTRPGAYSCLGSNDDPNAPWNTDINTIHGDAGICWWLEFVREHYGGVTAGPQPFFVPGQDPKPADKVWKSVDQLSDDFEGATLDTTKWQSEPIGNGWMWDGRPPALFKASNVTVRDGKMRVTVGKLEAPMTKNGKTFTHQGAIVRSLAPGQVGWYFECRMKANQTEMSSTFWLMTKGHTKKKLELDIQECVGRTTYKTEHWGKGWDQIFHSNAIHRVNKYNPTKVQLQAQQKTETKNWERYYVYGAWWKSPEEIRFYLDGRYTYSIHPRIAWDVPAYIQMAIETYSWNPLPDDGGLVESGTWEQRTTQYDWVRVWKLEPTSN